MPKKKKIFKYGNNEIPEIYEEIVHFKGKPSFVRYYFKNEKNNKIRAIDKDKIIELYNSFRKRHNKSIIPLITENPSNKDIFSNSKSLKEKLEFLKEKFKIVNQDAISCENEKEVEINGRKIRLDQNTDIPRQWLLEQFKLLLTENPKLLSQELAIEELSYLSKLVPQKRYTLKEIGNFYLERQKYTPKLGLTKKNKNESSQYWNEFILISKADYIDQIDKEIIVKYNTELTNVATNPTYRPNWLSRWQKKSINNKSLSAKWVKVRLDTIKTILKNAIKAADYTQDLEAVYKLCHYCPVISQIMTTVYKSSYFEHRSTPA